MRIYRKDDGAHGWKTVPYDMDKILFRAREPDNLTLKQAEELYPEGGEKGEPIPTVVGEMSPIERSSFKTLVMFHQMAQIQAMYTNGVDRKKQDGL